MDSETNIEGEEGELPVNRFQLDWVWVPISSVVHQRELPPPLTATYIVDSDTEIDGLDGEEPVNRFQLD